MPQFCRHGRFVQNCRICSAPEPKPAARPRTSAPARRPGTAAPRTSGVVVRRLARAVEDGYENELVPGLKASGDARRLADELAFSTARLAELAADPPGLYAEAALAEDLEESLWLAFLVAHVSPLAVDAGDAFSTIRAVRRPWATGELPPVGEGGALGPRTTVDARSPERTVAAYRAWAQRHGGSQAAALTGDDNWTAERRFQRVFERLSLPGFGRAGRFELLVSLGRMGLVDVAPPDLQLGEAADPAVVAAKRVFGIGERFLMERRAADLASEAGVPLDALDLALFNFGQPPDARATMGSAAEPGAELRARVERALGV
ncbi:MAG TPA: hypothetical protein VGW75_01820 [Solirubrobacteraceae bacterium]|jgi:hypothetical protein|nr:hypothetical protein [Solirubrobacteraceae bacterium]